MLKELQSLAEGGNGTVEVRGVRVYNRVLTAAEVAALATEVE